MRKCLLALGIVFCSILSSVSFAQTRTGEFITLEKVIEAKGQQKAVSQDTLKGKPLNSSFFLRSYKPQPTNSFFSSQINFKKHQEDISLELAAELGNDTLYANLIYSDEWQGLAEYEIPYGLYSFTAKENSEFNEEFNDIGLDCNAGVYANGKYYGIHPITFFGSLQSVGYYVVDANSWTLEKDFIIDDAGYEDMASAMTFDPTTNTIFALRYNSSLTGLNWAVIDTATFTFRTLNKWSGSFNMVALCTSPEGVIYGVGLNGNLYTLDKADGTPTLIGSMGITPSGYTQSAIYNSETSNILWSAVTYLGTAMYTIDTETGQATKLYDFPNNEHMVGLFSKTQTAKENAPAIVNDLRLDFDAPGGLTGNIAFTLPSLTYSGTALKGNLHVVTKIDGVVADEKDMTPGTAYSLPFSLSNSNHTFAVTTSNDAGLSPVAILNEYVGYDNPKAIGNLSYNVGEDGISTLTWDAPTSGVSNGYINPDSLYYKVVRYPDVVTVADRLKETNFSETLPSLMARYSYQITAYNGADKKGKTITSEEIIYGNGFVPPYVQKFEDSNSLEFFNIIDGNNDGTTWRLLYNVIACWPDKVNDADDWLISPTINLEAGKLYRLTVSTKALWSPAVESMKIALGRSQSDTTTFTQLLWDDSQIDYYNYTDQIIDFSVNESGKYYVGFYAYSSLVNESNGLYIDDIAVDMIGALNAPDSVANLTIVPDVNDEQKATISFDVPTKTLNGDELTSINAIKVYRNDNMDDAVYTFTNPVAGTSVSWTDEFVPEIGINTYTVIPENSSGTGRLATVSEFIGIYTAPYSEGFEDKASFDFYTFLSLNSDNSDWSYTPGEISAYTYSNTNNIDDWMIFPAFKLEKETVYEFTINYTTSETSATSLTLGRSRDSESQQTVAELPTDPLYQNTQIRTLFSTSEGGKYYPGLNFQTDSSLSYYYAYIDSVSITKVTSTKSPGAVQNLNITADANGERSVTISFDAPVDGYNGGVLESISKIGISRSNDFIASKTFENPEPGTSLTWTDNNVSYGYVKYAIQPENEYGKGKVIIDSVYVGPDKPSNVTNLKLMADADNKNVSISWTKPLGENNGYIDYNSLTYNLYAYNIPTDEFVLVKEGITDTTLNIEENVTGSMNILYYAVSAVLNDYEGPALLGHVVLGTPYTLPFKESFSDGGMTTTPWVTAVSDYSVWDIATHLSASNGLAVTPQDNDGGMLIFFNQGTAGDGYVDIPKIELNKKSITKNELRFWVYQSPYIATENSYVVLDISANDKGFEQLSDTLRLNDGEGWVPYSINLDTYKSTDYLTIRMYAHVNSYTEALCLDNVSILSLFQKDIAAISISGEGTAKVAADAVYSVNIENAGYEDVAGADYSVVFYNEDEVIGSADGVDLSVGESSSFSFTIQPEVTDIGKSWKLSAKVEFSKDQLTANNKTNALTVDIEGSGLPEVNDLSAAAVDDEAQLNWSQPNLDHRIMQVDSLETYKAFSIDSIGDWEVADLDSQYTATIKGLDFENQGEAQAYSIWSQKEAGASSIQSLEPHSGDQCLISWASAGILASDESSVDPVNNDWLISPEIEMGSSIGFWAAQPSIDYGYETFEIWTSSSSNDLSAFTKQSEVTLNEVGWIYYSFDLPSDAKYFAIRHTSSAFALMLDDIAFKHADSEIVQYNLLGYNVYRNGSKVSGELVTNPMYSDILTSSGSYTYQVNVLYESGESALSNEATIDLVHTGIGMPEDNAPQIYSGNGKVIVRGLPGDLIKVFSVDGKQIAAFSCSGMKQSYSLSNGVYVVVATKAQLSEKIIIH